MTAYDPAVVASSTSIIFAGAQYLFSAIWSFMPVVLTIVIPLGLLFAAYHLVKGKAKLR